MALVVGAVNVDTIPAGREELVGADASRTGPLGEVSRVRTPTGRSVHPSKVLFEAAEAALLSIVRIGGSSDHWAADEHSKALPL
jgi:hypothetical protein